MTGYRFAFVVIALLGGATAASAAPLHHHAKRHTHHHLVRRQPLPRQPLPRPVLATVAYQGAGVPYVVRVPAPAQPEVGFFSTSFLGDIVLAATVPPPQPQCIERRVVSRETQRNPPWSGVGPAPIYCEIEGP